ADPVGLAVVELLPDLLHVEGILARQLTEEQAVQCLLDDAAARADSDGVPGSGDVLVGGYLNAYELQDADGLHAIANGPLHGHLQHETFRTGDFHGPRHLRHALGHTMPWNRDRLNPIRRNERG